MLAVLLGSEAAFLSPVFQWSLGVIYLAAMLLAAAGQPSYSRSEATRRAFVAYAVVGLCYTVYSFLLFRLIKPELVELQSQLMIENARAYALTAPGLAAEQPEVMFSVERLRPTVMGTVFSYAQSLLFGGALAFLVGFALGRRDGSTDATGDARPEASAS